MIAQEAMVQTRINLRRNFFALRVGERWTRLPRKIDLLLWRFQNSFGHCSVPPDLGKPALTERLD